MDDLFTIEEASEKILKVPTSRGRALVRDGKIPHLRLAPRVVRIPRAALEAWLAEQTTRPSKPETAA